MESQLKGAVLILLNEAVDSDLTFRVYHMAADRDKSVASEDTRKILKTGAHA